MNKVLKTSAPSAPSATVLIIKYLEAKQMGADKIYLLLRASPNLPEGEEKKPLPTSPEREEKQQEDSFN